MPTITTKSIQLGSISLSLAGIRRMWKELNALLKEQADIELSQLVKPPEQTQEEFDLYKEGLKRDIFKVLGTVEYENDEAVHDDDPEIVRIDEGGSNIRFIYLSNITPYREKVGVKPEYAFELIIDLRSPPLLDIGNVLSAPTPNDTRLSVSGSRTGWQAGIEAVVRKNIARTRKLRSWFHGPMRYDLFLFLVGFPLSLYACWIFHPLINRWLSGVSPVVAAAAYLYVSFCVLWAYRFMFGYAKWAFPMVDITDQKTTPARHRLIWWTLIVAIFTEPLWAIVSDLIKNRLLGNS